MMSSTAMKVFIATLAALGTTNALPQQVARSSVAPSVPSAAPPANQVATPEENAALLKELSTAPSAIQRFKTLFTVGGEGKKLLEPEELRKRTVFDFNGAKPAPGSQGGTSKAANVETFPVLFDLGISVTVVNLTACGMNTPHVHPRATELLTVTKGNLTTGFVTENGLVEPGQKSEIANNVTTYEAAVFPVGSVHYQFNPECENTIFVAALSDSDPGTTQIAQGFFNLNGDVVNATLGFPKSIDGKDVASFRSQIPANLALAHESCMKRCGL